MRTFIWITTIISFIYSIVTFSQGEIALGVMNLSFALLGLDIFYIMKPKKESEKDEEVKFN